MLGGIVEIDLHGKNVYQARLTIDARCGGRGTAPTGCGSFMAIRVERRCVIWYGRSMPGAWPGW